jgi:hypothetical protein
VSPTEILEKNLNCKIILKFKKKFNVPLHPAKVWLINMVAEPLYPSQQSQVRRLGPASRHEEKFPQTPVLQAAFPEMVN